jgi:hypothetical protein
MPLAKNSMVKAYPQVLVFIENEFELTYCVNWCDKNENKNDRNAGLVTPNVLC